MPQLHNFAFTATALGSPTTDQISTPYSNFIHNQKNNLKKCKINLQLHILIKPKMLFLIKNPKNAKIPPLQTKQTKIENAAALEKPFSMKKNFIRVKTNFD